MVLKETRFEFDPGYPEDVECVVCLTPWTQPVEAVGCGHIFCAGCLQSSGTTCPTCRATIDARRDPNRVLRNIVDNLPGSCVRCGWAGTRVRFLQVHSAEVCDAELRARGTPESHSERFALPTNSAARAPAPAAAADDDDDDGGSPARQSSDVMACPDSTNAFMGFFANSATAGGGGGAPDAAPASLGAQPEHATGVRPSDGASSPAFTDEVSVAVSIIRGIDGCAPPLEYSTIVTPLSGCCVLDIARAACPDVLRAAPGSVSGALTAIAGDRVITDLVVPLASQGVHHGTAMYILTDGVQDHAKAVELFRLRSQIDQLVRDLRKAEAMPAASQQGASGGSSGVRDWRLLGEQLTQLLIRVDAVDDLVPPLRQLKRRTCADASCAEEILDRLRASRTPQPDPEMPRATSTSFSAVPGPASQVDALSAEPWLLYNLSQRFYDSLLAAFAAFDPEGEGTINRRELTQLCRWMNLPSDAVAIGGMLDTFCGTQPSGANGGQRRVSFHHICVWVQGSQRRPLHDYGLSFERYHEAIDVFHSLDQDRSGGLTPTEAESFIVRFGRKDRHRASEMVGAMLHRMQAIVNQGNPLAASAAAAGAARGPSTISSSSRAGGNFESARRWAATRREEILLDLVLRVLCTDEQGWDLCEPVAGAADDDGAATAQPHPRAAGRSSQAPSFFSRQSSAGPSARPSQVTPAPTHPPNAHTGRVRSATAGPNQSQGRSGPSRNKGGEEDCIVA